MNNVKEKFAQYVEHPCFDVNRLTPENPYQRAIRRQDLLELDLEQPIELSTVFTNKNLLIHKILNTIYEQDLLLLDDSFNTDEGVKQHNAFYNPYFISLGKDIKPYLEYLAFHFLDESIEIIGSWTKSKFSEYVGHVISQYEATPNQLCQAISHASSPEMAAKNVLIQMSSDFLTEASGMGRALLGAFGEEQSELMKVFIDEFGYGVYEKKHSTLFEKTLDSVGLSSRIHYYYNDYLPTSLMLVNYFHYLCSNRGHCFKHLGALYYSEVIIPHFNSQLKPLLKKLFPQIDADYFDEHIHIDKHHHRMVMEKIIFPSIDQYGENVIDEVLKGIESCRLLFDLSDKDLISQIEFHNKLSICKSVSVNQFKKIGDERVFSEIKDEITSSHIHSESELFTVNEGSLIFYASLINPVILSTGQSIVIPKGRVHSTVVQSDNVRYTVQSVEELS